MGKTGVVNSVIHKEEALAARFGVRFGLCGAREFVYIQGNGHERPLLIEWVGPGHMHV